MESTPKYLQLFLERICFLTWPMLYHMFLKIDNFLNTTCFEEAFYHVYHVDYFKIILHNKIPVILCIFIARVQLFLPHWNS